MACSANATIEDLAIRNCITSSAVSIPVSGDQRIDVAFRRMLFEDNDASLDQTLGFTDFEAFASGGAIRADLNTFVTVIDSVFTGNVALHGGAIYTAGSLSVSNSVFRRNEATQSGGGAIDSNAVGVIDDATSLRVEGCQFVENSALNGQQGGAPFNPNGAPIEADEFLKFASPTFTGGALLVREVVTVDIISSTFEDNTATSGGAIFFATQVGNELPGKGGPVEHEIRNCTFTGNIAKLSSPDINHGGAIFLSTLNRQVAPRLIDDRFIGNKASFGGALHALTTHENEITINGCHFEENEATMAGRLFCDVEFHCYKRENHANNRPTTYMGYPCSCQCENVTLVPPYDGVGPPTLDRKIQQGEQNHVKQNAYSRGVHAWRILPVQRLCFSEFYYMLQTRSNLRYNRNVRVSPFPPKGDIRPPKQEGEDAA